MSEAKFFLSKEKVKNQVKMLTDLGLKVSYSYKTNREVGKVLQEICPEVDFSIHSRKEISEISDKSKISFFTQAESEEELLELLNFGIRNFVVDNEVDLERLLKVIFETKTKIDLSFRMKFQEHRIGTGKYFVYGMSSNRVNELILKIRDNEFIENLGVHIHRKSQNTSEWEIKEEIRDSFSLEVLERINFLNIGGGLPSVYRSYTAKVLPYIFKKISSSLEFLKKHNISMIVEPGRFIAAPSVLLKTKIIQIYDSNVILNTTIYNCALDTVLTGTKMLVEGELGENEIGEHYLLKGNSPTRDDIFRYKVKLSSPKVGDEIVFLNAGAYNYSTDFFGYKKLETKIVK